MRVAARDLNLQRRYTLAAQMRRRSVGYAASGHGEMIRRPRIARRPDQSVTRGARLQEPAPRSAPAGRLDEYPPADTSGIGEAARVGGAAGRRGIHDDGQVRPKAGVGDSSPAQADLLLHRDQRRQPAWRLLSLQATEQMQQENAAGPVVDAFAGYPRPGQSTQF